MGLPPSALKIFEDVRMEAVQRMTGIRPQCVYLKTTAVLIAVSLKLVVTYIFRLRHTITKTSKGQALLEEYRWAGRK